MCDNKTPFDFVIYHRDCDDGYASAWAAWTVLKDKANYHPAQPSDKFVNGNALPDLALAKQNRGMESRPQIKMRFAKNRLPQ